MVTLQVQDSQILQAAGVFHAFSAETSDGKEKVKGYRFRQMLKFALAWLIQSEFYHEGSRMKLVHKMDGDGNLLRVRIVHEHKKFQRIQDALKRGLTQVIEGDVSQEDDADALGPPFVKEFIAVKHPGPRPEKLALWEACNDEAGHHWLLTEVTPEAKEDMAANLIERAKAIEAEAAQLRQKANNLKNEDAPTAK